MRLVCLLANQHETFTWKDTFSVFSVLQGSAEALIRWGGQIYHLLIAYFLSNISAKYENLTMLSRVIAKNIGDFFLRHSVVFTIHHARNCHDVLCKATSHPRPTQPSIPPGSVNEYQLRLGRQRQVWFILLLMNAGCAGKTEIPWERVPYRSTLEVWSRRGAIQIHVYLYLSTVPV